MRILRRAHDRGATRTDWLDSRHTFSFGHYRDPDWMGYRSLRVLNDDRVAPGRGFGMHPHRDMEILTYVLDGALEHRDSMGNASVLQAGELQRMSAGSGILHSEVNPSPADPAHFLQIWILPESRGLEPGYEQRRFERRGLAPVATPDGREGSLRIHQDAEVWLASLDPGERADYRLAEGRHAWAHVATGRVRVGDLDLEAGDAVGLEGAQPVRLAATEQAAILLFDLA